MLVRCRSGSGVTFVIYARVTYVPALGLISFPPLISATFGHAARDTRLGSARHVIESVTASKSARRSLRYTSRALDAAIAVR
jgi:hypothetical protein